MVLLCFVLDLTTIHAYLLKDLKQCLLQLSNLYVVQKTGRAPANRSSLYNPFALCCIQKNEVSGLNELNVTYGPKTAFNLRDFHHVVNGLSVGTLSPVTDSFDSPLAYTQVSCLGTILTDEGLYSWAPRETCKKIIMISTRFTDVDLSFQSTVRNAADHCVAVDFIQVETQVHSNGLGEDYTDPLFSKQINQFATAFADAENCSFRKVKWDTWSFSDLVKCWLQNFKEDEYMQAMLLFKRDILESRNKIFCSLFPSRVDIQDKCLPCQLCRCHGAALTCMDPLKQGEIKPVCPVTGENLDDYDLTDSGLRIGHETILLLPSFKKIPTLESDLTEIELNIMKCVRLASIHEGLLFGSSHTVIAASNHEINALSDVEVQTETNAQIFYGLCQVLYSKDSGLICSSSCDIETRRETSFPCFYLLQPSDYGPMLLRRIASAEEYLPFQKPIGASDIPDKLISSISSNMEKMELHDYNPLDHERGCHTKLNWFVKESLQLRSTQIAAPTSIGQFHSRLHSENLRKVANDKRIKSPSQLVKDQIPSIIQRMEPLKLISQSGIESSHFQPLATEPLPIKKPLIPFRQSPDSDVSTNSRLKPNFKRIKRTRD